MAPHKGFQKCTTVVFGSGSSAAVHETSDGGDDPCTLFRAHVVIVDVLTGEDVAIGSVAALEHDGSARTQPHPYEEGLVGARLVDRADPPYCNGAAGVVGDVGGLGVAPATHRYRNGGSSLGGAWGDPLYTGCSDEG